jgi:hypothetical protein
VLRVLLIALIFLGSGPASAQIYKHVDEDGNVTFTDRARPNATPVEIRTTNTLSPPSPDAYPLPDSEATNEATSEAAAVEFQVTITNPANETIIARGPGNFTVTSSVTPSLSNGHQLQLMMDGVPREEANSYGTWPLTGVFRGEHKLEVSVVTTAGEIVSTSEPITVFVFRPSSNFSNKNTSRPRPTPR